MNASDLLEGHRVIPVVVIDNAAHALPLGKTLLDSGIRALEITLRTEAGLSSIKTIAEKLPELIVGAGSIRQSGQLAAAIDAGAKFLVSPGSTDTLLDEATKAGLPFVPGAATASEMMKLLERGYRLQKFFPAEQLGGLAMINALTAPLPEVMLFPTGGINRELAVQYLAHNRVACVGGSWFVPQALIRTGDFDSIGTLASEAAKLQT
jgi:2-dehydro-3-deoxyphosphogluconate aldolase/(4S)-4-hydroxy-2-oxoglutarate aldolase